MDRRIETFFANLPAGFLERSLRYVNNAGVESVDPAQVIVPHFFNHQTHHRGQAHAMITAAGEKTGDTDLPFVL